jgi:hypothetical protein
MPQDVRWYGQHAHRIYGFKSPLLAFDSGLLLQQVKPIDRRGLKRRMVAGNRRKAVERGGTEYSMPARLATTTKHANYSNQERPKHVNVGHHLLSHDHEKYAATHRPVTTSIHMPTPQMGSKNASVFR